MAKHSVIYGLGDVLSRLAGFLLIPLYTHYLTTADYGVLELLELTSYVLAVFLSLGMSDALLRFYFEFEEQEKKDQVISVALITVWILSACGALGLSLFASTISQIVFDTPDLFQLFQILFLSLFLMVSNEIPLALFRIEQRSLLYVSISLSRVLIQLVLNVLFVVQFDMGVMGILLGSLIAHAVTGAYLAFYVTRRIRFSYSFKLLREMTHYGFPMMWSWCGGFLLHYCDRFLLQRLASLSDVGIYALAYKFGFILNVILLTPFRRTWAPKQFEVAGQENARQTFSLVFTYYCAAQFFLTLGISAIIEEVIFLVSAPDYHSASRYVPLILLAYNFHGASSFLHFGILYEKKTRFLAYATLLAGVVNVLANIYLIPIWGIWGATGATLGAFALLFAVTYSVAQKLYYIPLERLRLAKLALAAIILYLLTLAVQIDIPLLAIAVKGAIACLYPLVLGLFRFFRPEELRDLRGFACLRRST